MTDILAKYGASSNLTVTNLASLAASTDWTTGWMSGIIDNSSTKAPDYTISGTIALGGTVSNGGQIQFRFVERIDDSTWPAPFGSAVEASGIAMGDTEERDDFPLIHTIEFDTTTNASHPFFFSLGQRLGRIIGPEKFIIYIAQNSGNTLKSSGQQVTVKAVGTSF